jgi:hypothetical protein
MVIKVGKQLPATGAIDTQTRRTPPAQSGVQRSARSNPASTAQVQVQGNAKNASFSLQLNQQLTSMQSADSYLSELAAHLGQLKLRLSRELGNAQSNPAAREELEAEMQAVRAVGSAQSTQCAVAGFTLALVPQ